LRLKFLKRLSNSIYDYETFKINLIPFIATYVSGEIILAEHKEYKLLDKSELLRLGRSRLPIFAILKLRNESRYI
jgi:8-oxo-dGTP diphosphatase